MTSTTFKALATALFLFAMPTLAHAGDIDDCRSKEQIPNEARIKACTAVIDGKQASTTDTAYAYYKRAMVGSANPNADQTLVMADVSKAIELDPKLMEAYAFRAIGYNRAMQYDKAVADLTKAIEIAPERWGLYSLRAMVNAQKKDNKAAIADFKAALDHNPPSTSADMIRQRITKLEQQTQ
ncbi:MAG: tetratricopeptide repeat protein [Alphaproteobacteria bacterium]|uniref:tetratricopeptide repeat protein n=1 Tax=Aestuariivirga sp. TaxID=2650926 RepID=UPI003018A7C3|nr:tetratricopeptide repeat protein [Alphaproteobacteria bacterium]